MANLNIANRNEHRLMKTIRQTLILLTFALFFAANVTAAPLDERQRTVETVVADALAQLPAATAGDYDKIMGELAATGAEGVGILADMLVPASQGENAAVEYALNGVASFVTAAGREQLRPAVCEGLLAALARCKDDANRAFLVSQLQLCATADNAAALAAYIDDPYLGDPVLRALISIPDSEATLLSLARRSDLSDAQRAALAYAFGEKRNRESQGPVDDAGLDRRRRRRDPCGPLPRAGFLRHGRLGQGARSGCPRCGLRL